MTVTIGIDPHEPTHTAVAIDGDERQLARFTLRADRHQTDRLLAWAKPLDSDRVWAIESAAGLGWLLAQQLIAAGEQVVDVPPTVVARVRLFGSTRASKNDPNDAFATAIAGPRHCGLRTVLRDDHTAVLRLLAGIPPRRGPVDERGCDERRHAQRWRFQVERLLRPPRRPTACRGGEHLVGAARARQRRSRQECRRARVADRRHGRGPVGHNRCPDRQVGLVRADLDLIQLGSLVSVANRWRAWCAADPQQRRTRTNAAPCLVLTRRG